MVSSEGKATFLGTHIEDQRIAMQINSGPKKRLPQPQNAPNANANNGKRTSASDQIVQEVVQGLFEGRYVPGQKLTEMGMSRQFRVGRNSVREALKRLAAEGIVTESLHRGANIRVLSRREARDIMDIIELLAVLAARRSAERLRAAAEVKSLRELRKDLRDFHETPDMLGFRRLSVQVYRQLAHVSQNQDLTRLINSVIIHVIQQSHLTEVTLEVARQHAAQFDEIVGAVLAKDASKAERAMRRHVRRAAKLVETFPEGVLLSPR